MSFEQFTLIGIDVIREPVHVLYLLRLLFKHLSRYMIISEFYIGIYYT